ncbi:MAG: late competence development ComFB family protein [Leptospiraceae bacterium]|nr:late competence development ComFB family protein [Leptospiraceae bacterium]
MNKKVLKINEISHNAYNTVENQLRKVLKGVIEKNPNWGWEQISLQDVYACAINRLPANYTKKGKETISPIKTEEIEKAVKIAMYKISQNPIHLTGEKNPKSAEK